MNRITITCYFKKLQHVVIRPIILESKNSLIEIKIYKGLRKLMPLHPICSKKHFSNFKISGLLRGNYIWYNMRQNIYIWTKPCTVTETGIPSYFCSITTIKAENISSLIFRISDFRNRFSQQSLRKWNVKQIISLVRRWTVLLGKHHFNLKLF